MVRKNETAIGPTPPRGVTGLHTLGNLALLELHKVAFICSRSCPAALASRLRDWASRCRTGTCVVSGFQSPMEKALLRHLLEAGLPAIQVLASGLPASLDHDLQAPLAAGRLLVVTRYAASVTHPCRDKCRQRNRMLLELSDEVVIGYASAGGTLERFCREYGAIKRFTFVLEGDGG